MIVLGVAGRGSREEVKQMPLIDGIGGTMALMNREDQLEEARKALRLIREENWRIAGAARFFGISIPMIHAAACCQMGEKCIGFGCRIREGPED
jgi:hypothetical protein